MRGRIEGLISPHPVGAMLPGIYQDDDFAQRFTSGLDEVIAPVFSTLDNLPAYFTPWSAPEDFLDFLARWVGIDFEASWSVRRRRQVIAHAVDLHRRRGTVRGIREAVALVIEAPVEVGESGGSSWSTTPGAPLPGHPTPSLVVRVDVEELTDLERRRLDALVGAVKPADVPHTIEVGPVQRPRSAAGDVVAAADQPVREEPAPGQPAPEPPAPEAPVPEASVPDDRAFGEQAPGEQAPGDQAPGDQAPGEQAPGDQAPGEQAPGEQAPGDQAPGDQAPGDQAPGDQAPGDQAPGDQAPGDQASDSPDTTLPDEGEVVDE